MMEPLPFADSIFSKAYLLENHVLITVEITWILLFVLSFLFFQGYQVHDNTMAILACNPHILYYLMILQNWYSLNILSSRIYSYYSLVLHA